MPFRPSQHLIPIAVSLPLIALAASERAHPFAPEIMKIYTAANTPMVVKPPAGVAPEGGLSFEREWVAANVLPAPRQVAWQQLGFIAFIHFGPNTFTGREWGTGKESPSVFNPKKLDARQWVRALKSAGIRMVVLTTKHHDGFCLWPSRFTDHSVKNSPWKDGKGDVVRELADAAKAEGLKLGVYLSPADLNAIQKGVYGKTAVKPRVIPTPVPGWTPKSSVTFRGSWDDYNAYFMNQLFELLTEYGDIAEVWFDGANPHDIGQKYAYHDWYALIRKLQPGAAIFGKGPDQRWIGNERGNTRLDEWNVLPTGPKEDFADRTDTDLGSREKLAGDAPLFWHPGETNVSIRPGWFYHAAENDRLHSLDRLLDMWYGSAGGNTVFMLNVPPDQDGLFHDNDVKRLAELGRVLEATFARNLAKGARVTATPVARPGTSAEATLDGDAGTGWAPADWNRAGEVVYTLPEKRTFNRVSLMEDIRDFGQRVEKHAIDVRVDGVWKPLTLLATAKGAWTEVGAEKKHFTEWGTIGHRRIHRTETVTADAVRVRFLDSRVCPSLAEFGLYLEPTRVASPEITRSRAGLVTIKLPAGVRARYTLDGSGPTKSSPLYAGAFELPRGGVVRALAEPESPGSALIVGAPEAIADFEPIKAKWRVVSVSGEETVGENAPGSAAIDDNPATHWHTPWKNSAPPPPHDLIVDMGESLDVRALTYLPRVAGPFVRDYAFALSEDGKTWTEVSRGEFGNIRNNPIRRTVEFTARKARFFKFTALREDENKPFVAAAEIGVLVK